MLRKNGKAILIRNPAKGLQTYFPPDMPEAKMGQYIVVAKNVRAERGVLANAPGYERIVPTPGNLDSPANMIFQADLSGRNDEAKNAVVVGTESKLYVVGRRARQRPVCLRGGGPVDPRCSDPVFAAENPEICNVGGGACRTTFAIFGDSGRISTTGTALVATNIRNSNPDFILHCGDLVYGDSTRDETLDIYEELFARYYWWAIGGYRGSYGVGPTESKLFAVPGNHDYTDPDGGIDRYTEILRFPGDGINYTFKRGAVQVWMIAAYGPETRADATEGEDDLSSTSPLAVWLQTTAAASDATWKIVCFGFPPYNSQREDLYAILRWPFADWGIHAVVSGDEHAYERLDPDDGVVYLVSGLGGKSRVTPSSFVPESVAFYNSAYGAVYAVADSTSLLFQFRNTADELIDEVALVPDEEGVVCYVSDIATQPTELRVVPVSATLESGQYWQFRAYLSLINGNVQDVTALATWSSDDTGVATVNVGRVTGISPGTDIVISAEYSGVSGSAEVDVVSACVDRPTEVVIVVDASESMGAASGHGKTRLDRLKEAATMFIDSLDPLADRVGVVSYSGDFATQTPSYTVVAPLSSDFAAAKLALSGISSGGDCGMAAGLAAAYGELTGPSARSVCARPSTSRFINVSFTAGITGAAAVGAPLDYWNYFEPKTVPYTLADFSVALKYANGDSVGSTANQFYADIIDGYTPIFSGTTPSDHTEPLLAEPAIVVNGPLLRGFFFNNIPRTRYNVYVYGGTKETDTYGLKCRLVTPLGPKTDWKEIVPNADFLGTWQEDKNYVKFADFAFADVEETDVYVEFDGGQEHAVAGIQIERLDSAESEAETDCVSDKHALCVLFCDNPADVCDGGDASTLALARVAAMAAAQTEIELIKELPRTCVAVIALDVDSDFLEQLQSWAAEGLFFPTNNAENLLTVFGNLNNLFCMEGCDGYYVVNPPGDCPPGTPRLNYDDFQNWDVVSGVVDLCGVGNTGVTLYDIWPGHRLYVDLRGSSGNGVLRTKDSWPVAEDEVIRLTFKMAGNGRQEGVQSQSRIRITLSGGDDLLDETLTLPTYNDFAEFSYEVTATAAGSIQVVFEALATPAANWQACGNFLDDVLLENVTTVETLLDDNFDEETC